MVYWYFSLVGKRRDIVPVIKRLLAPRLIIERVICRCIYGIYIAYFRGTKCYICRAASLYKLIQKNFVGCVYRGRHRALVSQHNFNPH